MNTHQILYKKPMILAKKKRWKTVTRRPIKPQENFPVKAFEAGLDYTDKELLEILDTQYEISCPYGRPGDQLFTKETYEVLECSDFEQAILVEYQADEYKKWMQLSDREWEKYRVWNQPFGTKPSIFMFKSLCRFWDEVTEIEAERVQDITHQQAIKEGIEKEWDGVRYWYRHYSNEDKLVKNPIKSFKTLWQSMYEGGPFDWNNNPYVWAVSYKPLIVDGQTANVKSETAKAEAYNG